MARWLTEEGAAVRYVNRILCGRDRPAPDRDPPILRAECAAAPSTLGIPRENLCILDRDQGVRAGTGAFLGGCPSGVCQAAPGVRRW